MFWKGRINAIIFISMAIGIIMFTMKGEYAAAAGFVFFMFGVKIALGLLNILWTAATGNPLFYDVKVLSQRGRRDDAQVIEDE